MCNGHLQAELRKELLDAFAIERAALNAQEDSLRRDLHGLTELQR